MNDIELKRNVRNKLLMIQSAERVNDKEIVMRCQFCGDSKKNLNKKRLYIKIDTTSNEPMMFHCFNCGESGILTPSILRSFQINDLELNSSLITYNKKTVGVLKKKLGITNNKFDFVIPMPKNTESNLKKKNYIENRLGIKLTVDDIKRFRIIFNLEQFLKSNDIDTVTVSKGRYDIINRDYIGFLTSFKEFINFRDITDKNKLRYDKYSIFKNLDNTRKFYTIPTSVDILTTDEITINIAEGIFDILGVYYNIKNQNDKNNIYVAVCGSGYSYVIRFFLQMGLIGENVRINIYSDNDKEPDFYKSIKKDFSPWINRDIKLYYNTLEKDFGVPSNKINIIEKRIK